MNPPTYEDEDYVLTDEFTCVKGYIRKEPKKRKREGKRRIVSCGRCGEQGHMRTNHLCPFLLRDKEIMLRRNEKKEEKEKEEKKEEYLKTWSDIRIWREKLGSLLHSHEAVYMADDLRYLSNLCFEALDIVNLFKPPTPFEEKTESEIADFVKRYKKQVAAAQELMSVHHKEKNKVALKEEEEEKEEEEKEKENEEMSTEYRAIWPSIRTWWEKLDLLLHDSEIPCELDEIRHPAECCLRALSSIYFYKSTFFSTGITRSQMADIVNRYKKHVAIAQELIFQYEEEKKDIAYEKEREEEEKKEREEEIAYQKEREEQKMLDSLAFDMHLSRIKLKSFLSGPMVHCISDEIVQSASCFLGALQLTRTNIETIFYSTEKSKRVDLINNIKERIDGAQHALSLYEQAKKTLNLDVFEPIHSEPALEISTKLVEPAHNWDSSTYQELVIAQRAAEKRMCVSLASESPEMIARAMERGTTSYALASEEHEKELCVICMTDAKTQCLSPCNHVCLCLKCSDNLVSRAAENGHKYPTCPMCREKVLSSIRVFI